MTVPRRDFIKLFGISLGSLLLSRCNVPAIPTPTITPTPAPPAARDRLRLCWLRFGELARKTAEDSKKAGAGWEDNPIGMQMIADHRTALEEMTSAGGVAASVAGLIREA
jgi:hypothetical protein